jgi:Domain of unknown function (DUF1788)
LTDALDRAFQELRSQLGPRDRLTPTHADPFFTFVHDPAETLELHRRLRRWRSTLENDGFKVEVHSLSELAWAVVDASQRWDDWLEAEEPGRYASVNRSMRDVLLDDEGGAARATPGARPGLLGKLSELLQGEDRKRLVLLTDAALLHPWFRADKIGTSLHDRIQCPTVLFYPGTRRGQYGLRLLDLYPEDNGGYRTTLVGGL